MRNTIIAVIMDVGMGMGVGMAQQQSQLSLVTPAPPPVVSVNASYTGGGNGNTPIYYWVVVRYPSGTAIPTGPAVANGTLGSANLDASHFVTVSWTSTSSATGYDVVRSDTSNYPAPCSSCAIALNSASTTAFDTGGATVAYPTAGLNNVSAAIATMTINNLTESFPFINFQLQSTTFKSALIDPAATVGSILQLSTGGRLINSASGGAVTLIDSGSIFSISGCSATSPVGGSLTGKFTSGTTGACTVTVTMGGGLSAPRGWACFANDITTIGNVIAKTGGSTTTAVFSGVVTSGDVIEFGCPREY